MKINQKKDQSQSYHHLSLYIYSFYIDSFLFNLKMKYSFVIVFLLIGVSHCFFGPVGQVINNVGNSVNSAANNVGNSVNQATNQVGNSVHSSISHLGQVVEQLLNDIRAHVDTFIRELLNSINVLQSVANSLWDNVFSPAFDLLTKGIIYFY